MDFASATRGAPCPHRLQSTDTPTSIVTSRPCASRDSSSAASRAVSRATVLGDHRRHQLVELGMLRSCCPLRHPVGRLVCLAAVCPGCRGNHRALMGRLVGAHAPFFTPFVDEGPPSVHKPFFFPTSLDYRPRGPPREPDAYPHRQAKLIGVVAPVSSALPSRRVRHAGPAHGGRHDPPPARCPCADFGATSSPAAVPRRPAPSGRQPPGFPDRHPHGPAPGPRSAQFPIVRESAVFGAKSRPIVRG
jgi:hypothetical protein